jgi:RNA polymerase sigma-70 factor, ECF subfamily
VDIAADPGFLYNFRESHLMDPATGASWPSAMESEAAAGEITALLAQWSADQPEPVPHLIHMVYKDLRRIAGGYMRRERPDHTLEATALVHEAYLRIFQGKPFRWRNRHHFYRVLAQAMRRILVEYARTRKAGKRWGGHQRIDIEDVTLMAEERSSRLVALDEALGELTNLNPRQGEVVELLWFVGLTQEQTAAILGISSKTVQNDWRFARVWLKRRLSAEE